MRGALDIERLHRAFAALCSRHDALRSVFEARPQTTGQAQEVGQVCQIKDVDDCLDFRLETEEFELDWLLDQQYEVFDLETGPLCRVRILQESGDAWILHWTLHHVSVDLWSYTILLTDLEFAYRALAGPAVGPTAPITWPSPAPQYRHLTLASATIAGWFHWGGSPLAVLCTILELFETFLICH